MILKEDINKLYWKDNLSQKEIGKIYGKSQTWVYKQMRKYKIPRRITKDTKTRFLYHVKIPENPDGCWEWIGVKNEDGYGRFGFKGKNMLSHRVSYILHIGEFDQTLCVIHKCDNPSCVNPNHLYIGNHDDNMEDRNRKGRTSKGEKRSNSKLIEVKVKEIKKLLVEGITQKEIGRMFKVSPGNISQIKQGCAWKHIQRGG